MKKEKMPPPVPCEPYFGNPPNQSGNLSDEFWIPLQSRPGDVDGLASVIRLQWRLPRQVVSVRRIVGRSSTNTAEASITSYTANRYLPNTRYKECATPAGNKVVASLGKQKEW